MVWRLVDVSLCELLMRNAMVLVDFQAFIMDFIR